MCPVKRRRKRQNQPDSGCVRSVMIGHVQSRLERFWTSLEDRTLGGSVQSLPPERPVNRYRAGTELLFFSFPVTLGATIKLCRCLTYSVSTATRLHRRAAMTSPRHLPSSRPKLQRPRSSRAAASSSAHATAARPRHYFARLTASRATVPYSSTTPVP